MTPGNIATSDFLGVFNLSSSGSTGQSSLQALLQSLDSTSIDVLHDCVLQATPLNLYT